MPSPVVFSIGDPNGVGPEVLLKALEHLLPTKSIRPFVFGSGSYLSSLYDQLNLSFDWDWVRLFPIGPKGDCPFPPRWGEISEESGRIALESLRSAILYCRDQSLPLLVTAPVSKEALRLAGFIHPGQTEFLGSFFKPSDPTMVFLSDKLKVVLVTVHSALKDVFQELTVDRIVARATLFLEALRKLGITQPRVAVAGLNPHASEGGMFGDEEERLIVPAIMRLERTLGAGVFQGPFPPDTVFSKALAGEFDGVVAQYHDQGLIPVKMVAFDAAVNTTLGLPIIRTSPDHGTAFDIAGSGFADPGSMIAAIEWGLKLGHLYHSGRENTKGQDL